MRKTFSLDFLNKETFDTDILVGEGEKIYSQGDRVTPGIILKLYFQDIYKTKEEIVLPEGVEGDSMLANILGANDAFPEEWNEPYCKNVPFSKMRAVKLVEYARTLGGAMELEPAEMQKLEVAAYFHDVGKSFYTEAEKSNENYKELCKEATYNFLAGKKNIGISVAQAAKDYKKPYKQSEFMLSTREVPHAHILSIVSVYDDLMQEHDDKEKVLRMMLRMGGNRFNIYMLHKFITTMRNKDEIASGQDE